MKRVRIDSILEHLNSGERGIGWIAFLDTFSDLIRHVVLRFETNESSIEDSFNYVCAKLSDDDFRRLKAFDANGPATFRTWLTTVVGNLCKDQRRSVYGRKRLPAKIRELPELDRLVFECFFRLGMTHHESLHVVKRQFPSATLKQLSKINARLHSVLTGTQRWQLSIKRHDLRNFDDSECTGDPQDAGPEVLLQSSEDLVRLTQAMARLEPKQRLLLQLRYQQDLTLKEVALLIGLRDPFMAKRQIDAALAALARAMKI